MRHIVNENPNPQRVLQATAIIAATGARLFVGAETGGVLVGMFLNSRTSAQEYIDTFVAEMNLLWPEKW